MVHIRVDWEALVRRRTLVGEVCEIRGIGPIPVPAAVRFFDDAFVKAFVQEGADVTKVVHLDRRISAKLRTGLEVRDDRCVVPGCDERGTLEIDHRVPVSAHGETSLANCARLCPFHHAQKTFHGWKLGGGPGNWAWTGPDPP